MDTLINLFAKISGWTSTIMDLLPLLGAVGSLLSVGASICMRASAATNPADLIQALHPTAAELASVSLAVGLLKSHFNHQANAKAIDGIKPAQPSQP